MSGSHFGSGYWPDDFFGLYFQPEAGGVIIGTLAGSFAGTSAFSGTLEQPDEAVADVQSGAHGRKRGRDLQRFLDEQFDAPEPVAAVVQAPPPSKAKPARKLEPVAAVAKIEPLPAYDEEEDLILMLLAA